MSICINFWCHKILEIYLFIDILKYKILISNSYRQFYLFLWEIRTHKNL